MLKNMLLPALFSIIFLMGCQHDDPLAEVRAYVIEVESGPKGRIPPPPEFKAYEFFTYSAVRLRAPFEMPVEAEVLQENKPRGNVLPDFDRIKERLEEFRFESLEMTGTLELDEQPEILWALILDSDGDIHRVRTGNYLGRNYGKILNISETQIDVMEIVPDGQGGWIERPRALILRGLEL